MIQWYPGHMAKAKKEIEEKLKLVDIVFELLDARIPFSSQNPMFQDILKKSNRLIIITKASMADEKATNKWQEYYANKGNECIIVDAISGYNIKDIIIRAKKVLASKMEKDKNRGLKPRAIRAMVVGIPNVGKSTLINRLSGRNVTITANKPGVTKAQQWIRINKDLELLDTPGILWPKFESLKQSYNLSLSGAIKDDIVHKDDMILYFLDFLKVKYPDSLHRYNVQNDIDNLTILQTIAKDKGYLFINKDYDYERVYELIINDFRGLKLGRITLDDETKI